MFSWEIFCIAFVVSYPIFRYSVMSRKKCGSIFSTWLFSRSWINMAAP